VNGVVKYAAAPPAMAPISAFYRDVRSLVVLTGFVLS